MSSFLLHYLHFVLYTPVLEKNSNHHKTTTIAMQREYPQIFLSSLNQLCIKKLRIDYLTLVSVSCLT